MAASRTPSARKATVFAVLPPPTTGMTLCTRLIADRLAAIGAVGELNLSDGSAKITLSFRVAKFFRTLGALLRLLSGASRGGALYMSVNARRAMWYNIAAAAAARLWGSRVAAHHHIYAYITKPDWRVKLLDRVMGPSGVHVVLCDDMQSHLKSLYGCRAGFLQLPSTVMMTGGADDATQDSSESTEEPFGGQREFRVGHLANLSYDKGIDHVFGVFSKLLESHDSVKLVLAGPVMDAEARERLAGAQRDYPDRLDYRGPVYGADKEAFFRDIDLLLLPSRFDAQPVVISEAFERAKPVLAIGWSCIPGLIGPNDSWNICPKANYVDKASGVIENWITRPDEYQSASQRALERAAELRRDAQHDLDAFCEWVFPGAAAV
ncbi:Glycosyl transferases group 1 [Posidoniimonas polymericola]|uniref:Glycosyl transferases group 1 n=1 Tax=Posidoniimonas polymericola TaxID=2528002 RepID=A0A5C5YDE6_9BACT|nr:glycosyltransferase family 4 protein [Posidoniimonas polymericola]TWT73746.1 Glycosyl transferases group 1 [Posidoniimonas polymericola]